jgi:hypothetical protein
MSTWIVEERSTCKGVKRMLELGFQCKKDLTSSRDANGEIDHQCCEGGG